ncbi:MAG: mannitol dehydrogenase family protein [Jatrophihabitantaceae bacterium]
MTVTAVPLSSGTLAQLGGAGLAVPSYDRSRITVGIVHFGVGGFHRAHQAMYLDTLMNQGLAHDWGVCGVGLLEADRRMGEVMSKQDGLYTLVTKAADGSCSARVIGSIIDYLFAPDAPAEVLDVLTGPGIRVVTLTVTEAGYNAHRVTGRFDPDGPGIAEDLASPDAPRTVFGFLVEALARRRADGIAPFTVVSCDNVQGNGAVIRDALVSFARLRDADLAEWIARHVAFPNTMVDRITPATTDADLATVREQFGVADDWPVSCEPFTQWVIEDRFGSGRPPLERAGVQMVGDVGPYELMKLRLLNAGHQALGYAGCLAGYTYVHQAIDDPAFVLFLRRYWRDEAIPSLHAVPGIDLGDYVDELVTRFGNPHIRDTLPRLCVDGSERIPKFLLPVLRFNIARLGPIERCATILACWARYCEGTDEHGTPIDVLDPVSAGLRARALRRNDDPLSFVRNPDIFGDLAADERFAVAYRRALESVLTDGALATIAR